MKKSLAHAEVRSLLALLLLGMMPVGYAYYTSLKEEAQRQAVTKYTQAAVIGHPSYVRLTYGYPTNGTAEGASGYFLCRSKPNIPLKPGIWNSFYKIPKERWKIVFVEDLPNLNGKKTVGALVTVPEEVPSEVECVGVQLMRTREGEEIFYESKIQVERAKK